MRPKSLAVCAMVLVSFAACTARDDVRSDDPRPVMDAFVRIWNSHDTTGLDSVFAANGVHEDLALGFRGEGLAAEKAFFVQTIQSIAGFDWRMTSTVVEGSKLAAEWTLAGNYTGDTPSGVVSGRPFSIRGASHVETEAGRITRFSDYYNLTEFYRQVTAGAASP